MSNPSDSEKSPFEKPQIEVVSDEDWKTRVKAEDARLDAERSQSAQPEDEPGEAEDGLEEFELPPATFLSLVQMFATQAFAALGMFPGPDGKVHRDLPIAKHLIDLLGVLETKTTGQLTTEEHDILEQALHELRMVYVSVSKPEENSGT